MGATASPRFFGPNWRLTSNSANQNESIGTFSGAQAPNLGLGQFLGTFLRKFKNFSSNLFANGLIHSLMMIYTLSEHFQNEKKLSKFFYHVCMSPTVLCPCRALQRCVGVRTMPVRHG